MSADRRMRRAQEARARRASWTDKVAATSGAAPNGTGGAVDLSAAKMSDEQAWKVQANLEMALGKRCFGCGRRVGLGLRMVSLDVKNPQQPVVTRLACSREDCDFAEQARDGATFMEQVEFAWTDPLGVDGPSFGLGIHPHGVSEGPAPG